MSDRDRIARTPRLVPVAPEPDLAGALRALVRAELRAVLAEELAPLVVAVNALAASRSDLPRGITEFVTADEAAAIARVTPATVRAWVRAGRLPRHGTPRALRVRRADLEAFLATAAEARANVEAPTALADRVLRRAR